MKYPAHKWISNKLMDLTLTSISFKQKHLVEIVDEFTTLLKQLPKGMEDCTIIFKECLVGHGTLSATNWIQHPCAKCESDKDKALIRELLVLAKNYSSFAYGGKDQFIIETIQKAEAALNAAAQTTKQDKNNGE